MVKALLRCLLWCLVLFSAGASTAQIISYPLPAQAVTQGLDGSLLTVKIDFPACSGGSSVRISLGESGAPGAIRYIPGSLTIQSASSGVTVTEGNITDLTKPVFTVNNSTAGQSVQFTIKRVANCTTAASAKDAVYVTGGCTFSETDINLNTYNLFAPSLSITQPATLSNVDVGSNQTRNFTVTNGGNGCVDTLYVWVKYPSGSANLTSLSSGGTTFTPFFTNGDSSLFSITGAPFGSDGLFCNGESLTFTENFKVLKCNFNTTFGTAWASSGTAFCQKPTSQAAITMSNRLPNLTTSLETAGDPSAYCFKGDTKIQTIRIKNIGAGPATNIILYLRTSIPGAHESLLVFNRSLPINIVSSSGAALGTVTRIDSLGSRLYYPTSNCVGIQTVNSIAAYLPGDIIIPANGYIDVQVPVTAPNAACFSCRQSLAWATIQGQVQSSNQCGAGSYIENYKTYFNRAYSGLEYQAEAPTDVNGAVPGGDPFNLSLYITRLSTINAVDGSGQSYLNVLLGNTGIYPNATSVMIGNQSYPMTMSGDTLKIGPLAQNTDRFNINVNIPLRATCDAGGGTKALNVSMSDKYSPCADMVYLGCKTVSIYIHCPAPCIEGGATPVQFSLRRINYGRGDSNNDGIPDGALDMNKVASQHSINADTLAGVWNVKVYPNPSAAFKYVYFDTRLTSTAGAPIGGIGSLTALPNAVATIYPASGEDPIICTVSPTLTSGGRYAHYELGPGCRGSDWQAGDSIVFRALFKTNASVTSAGQTVFTTQNYVYSTNEKMDTDNTAPTTTTYTCDTYNDYNVISNLYLSPYIAGDQKIIGCSGRITAQTRQYTRAQGDLTQFPYEYRNFGVPDTLFVTIPPNFTYRPGSGLFTGTNVSPSLSIANSNVIQNGNVLSFVNLKNLFTPYGGSVIPADEYGVYSILFDLDPSCNTAAGNYRSSTNTSYAGVSPITPQNWTSSTPYSQTSGYIYYAPQPALTGSTASSSTTGTGNWAVTLQNLSGNAPAANYWFYFSPVNGLTNIQVKEGTTTITPDANGFYRLGDLAAGANRNFTITADATVCTDDSLRLNAGFSCGSYPAAFSAQVCNLTKWLKIQNEQSQIQLSVAKQPIVAPATSIELCTPVVTEFVINSAQPAFADNPRFLVYPPQGLTISTAQIEYPLGSGNWQTVQPTVVNGALVYKAEDHTVLNSTYSSNGLPGTIDAQAANSRQVKLRLTAVTDCNFRNRSRITVQQQGDRPCGEPIPGALGYDNIVRTNPIMITGVPDAGAADVQTTINPSTVSCNEFDVLGSITMIQNASTSSDTVFVTLARGLDYAGSFSSVSGMTYARQTTTASGTVLAFKIPQAIAVGTPIRYQFRAVPAPNSGCNNLAISTEVTRGLDPMTCNGVACPNQTISVIGSDYKTVTVQKPAITINNMVPVGEFRVGAANTLRITITNTASVAAPANSMQVQFFCNSSNTSAIATAMFPAAIAAGATVTADVTVNIPGPTQCNTNDRLTAKIIPNANTCVCSEASFTTTAVLPVTLRSFEAKPAGCDISAKWIVAHEANLAHYVVEWSTDGSRFTDVRQVIATGSSQYAVSFPSAKPGRYFIRLRMVDNDGSYSHSQVVAVYMECGTISIRPNVTSSTATVYGLEANETVFVYNPAGQLIFSKKAVSNSEILDLGKLANGTYLVVVKSPVGTILYSDKVIKK